MFSISFNKSLKILVVLIFGLICLGASVRAMNAGLSCPDWPLCFGDFIPDYHPQVYFEFIHRVIAGGLTIFSVIMGVKVLKSKESTAVMKTLVWIIFSLFIIQIIMGGLTVLKLLHPGTVTTHLAMGNGIFVSWLWITFMVTKGKDQTTQVPTWVSNLFLSVALLVTAQLLLGGWVASNYAGLACQGFPLCNGEWVPTMQGVIGIQVSHRFMAYLVFIIVWGTYWVMRTQSKNTWMTPAILKTSRWMVSLVLLQIAVGVANVMFKTPPLITVIHTGMASLLLAFSLRLVFITRPKIKA